MCPDYAQQEVHDASSHTTPVSRLCTVVFGQKHLAVFASLVPVVRWLPPSPKMLSLKGQLDTQDKKPNLTNLQKCLLRNFSCLVFET